MNTFLNAQIDKYHGTVIQLQKQPLIERIYMRGEYEQSTLVLKTHYTDQLKRLHRANRHGWSKYVKTLPKEV